MQIFDVIIAQFFGLFGLYIHILRGGQYFELNLFPVYTLTCVFYCFFDRQGPMGIRGEVGHIGKPGPMVRPNYS